MNEEELKEQHERLDRILAKTAIELDKYDPETEEPTKYKEVADIMSAAALAKTSLPNPEMPIPTPEPKEESEPEGEGPTEVPPPGAITWELVESEAKRLYELTEQGSWGELSPLLKQPWIAKAKESLEGGEG